MFRFPNRICVVRTGQLILYPDSRPVSNSFRGRLRLVAISAYTEELLVIKDGNIIRLAAPIRMLDQFRKRNGRVVIQVVSMVHPLALTVRSGLFGFVCPNRIMGLSICYTI